jgi:hypothetical protein
MNEPNPGFIGYRDLGKLENAVLAMGPVPGAFQGMIAASGQPVKVPVYTPWFNGWKAVGYHTINPRGLSLFKEGFSCPWKQAGVWAGEGTDARLLKPDHFYRYKDRPAQFVNDFLKPFMLRFMESINKAEKPALFFIEGVPHGETPSWSAGDGENTVNAFHHYDGFTLFTKSYRPWLTVDQKTGRIILGRKKTAAHYSAKLAEAKLWAEKQMEGAPCFLGEFGLPFDMNNKRAYKTGDYRLHEDALSLYYDAIDENMLGSAIWNYTADNNHEDGDFWNGEDLSIVTVNREGQAAGRAEAGWLRPYPMATAGIPLKYSWDRKRAVFNFRFRSNPKIEAPTEIFLPSVRFPGNPSISAKKEPDGGLRTEYDRAEQRLKVYNDGYNGEAEVFVTLTGRL